MPFSAADDTNVQTYNDYTGSGPLNYSWSHVQKADLNVEVDGVLLSQNDWTFSGNDADNGGFDGGSITLVTAVTNADVRIYRDMVRLRTTSLAVGGASAEDIDNELTVLTLMAQDARRGYSDIEASLALKLNITDAMTLGNASSGVTFAEMRQLTGADVAGAVPVYTGKSRIYTWLSGDQSALVTSDEINAGEGDGVLYVAPLSDKTGASGCWKLTDYVAGLPIYQMWWQDAVQIDPATGKEDWTPALEKIFAALWRLQRFEYAAGEFRSGGDLIVKYGDTNMSSALYTEASEDANYAVLGSGSNNCRFVLAAGETDAHFHIETRNNSEGRATRHKWEGVSFVTHGQAESEWALKCPEIEGGTSKGLQHFFEDLKCYGFDRTVDCYKNGFDFSGLARVYVKKCVAIGIWGPGLTPSDDPDARDDTDNLFKMKVGFAFDGCYDVDMDDCEVSSAFLAYRSHQGRSETAAGVRVGYGVIQSIANDGSGNARITLDTANHGITTSSQLRVSTPDDLITSGDHEISAYQVVNVDVTAVNGAVIDVDTPFVASAANNGGYVISNAAGGEGFKNINNRCVEVVRGLELHLYGQEAGAYIEKDFHTNYRDIGVQIDGAKSYRIDGGYHFRGGASPTDGRARALDYQMVNAREMTTAGHPVGRFNIVEPTQRSFAEIIKGPFPCNRFLFDQIQIYNRYDEVFRFIGACDDVKIINPEISALTGSDTLGNFASNVTNLMITDTGVTPDITVGADGVINLPAAHNGYVEINAAANRTITNITTTHSPRDGEEVTIYARDARTYTFTPQGNYSATKTLVAGSQTTLKYNRRYSKWTADS